MNAFQQGLDVEPAQPQGFPARWSIPFASQVTALAGNGMPTLLGGQLGSRHVGQVGHDLHQVGWQHLLGWLLRGLAGHRTQLQQPHRLRRKQSQQGAQALVGLDLALLHTTPGFEPLMEVLHDPAGAIPPHTLPSMLSLIHI